MKGSFISVNRIRRVSSVLGEKGRVISVLLEEWWCCYVIICAMRMKGRVISLTRMRNNFLSALE